MPVACEYVLQRGYSVYLVGSEGFNKGNTKQDASIDLVPLYMDTNTTYYLRIQDIQGF